MPFFRGFPQSTVYQNGIAAIGNFDGVHLGHQQILKVLTERSSRHNCPSVVLTFEPHPIQILRPEAAPARLTTVEQKADLILKCGVDHVIAYPTDAQFLNLDPDQFFATIIREKLVARGLVEGPNFYFGKGRAGTIVVLQKLCEQHQMTLQIVQAAENQNAMISSSAIRHALVNGDIKTALTQLNRPYSITGRVATGAQRGRTLGYPTANLTHVQTLIPADGVYACRCEIESMKFPAAVSIGGNPTFNDQAQKIEAHIIGYQGDLYGASLEIEFLDRLRAMHHFSSTEDLKNQLAIDVRRTQTIFSENLSES